MTPFERAHQLIETNSLDTVYLGLEIVIIATKDNNRYIYRVNSNELHSIETELKKYGYPKTIIQPEIGSVYNVNIDKAWRTYDSPY